MDTRKWSKETTESHETRIPVGAGTASGGAAATKEVQEMAQADTASGSFANGDPEVLKEVLSSFQECLDAFIADSSFDEEHRAFARHLVEGGTNLINVKVWADTNGQVYAPLSVNYGPRLPEASEEDAEGDPANVQGAQGGKKKKARKHSRRRQKR